MSSSSSPGNDRAPPGPTSHSRLELQHQITGPQLAAALEQHFNPDGTVISRAGGGSVPRRKSRQEDATISSTPISETDNIDDLGEQHVTHNSSSALDSDYKSTSPFIFPGRGFPAATAWQTYFMQEVAGDMYLEFQLLLMTIATGVLDSMTYTTYNVFTSKQTGNTLFLALYAFRSPALAPLVEQNVGVSMGIFIAGATFFGHIGHFSRQRRRIWLLASNAFQALLMLAAAAIRYFAWRQSTGPGALGILALLAFAESGQIANALNVAMPELNTTMITGALIQLCTDKKFFVLRNPKRNRRLAFFASMMLGCFIGASMIRFSSPTAALVVVAATKGLLFFTFFFNRGLVQRKMMLEDGNSKFEGTITPASKVLWGD